MIYLVRHARTQPNSEEAALWPLSEEGRRQAELLADLSFWRDVALIISSPEEKALATVRPAVARHGLRLSADERLRELRRPAVWVSQERYEQIVDEAFAAPQRSVEGWEPAGDVARRVLAITSELLAAPGKGNVALIGHGLSFSLLLAHLQGLKRPSLEAWRAIPFAAVAAIDPSQGALQPRWIPAAP
jgi:broad specificity phosphatase PhoE